MQKNAEQKPQRKYLITDKGYTQLIKQYTTDFRTQIDHAYTIVPQCVQSASTLESYYMDHSSIYITMKAV